MAKAIIRMDAGHALYEGALGTMPLAEGQYIQPGEGPEEAELDLGDRDDLTAGQEEFLNLAPAVLGYRVEK